MGESSAGGVYLLDGRSQRRRVGLVASEGTDEAQPLLSPTYYLERALTPFAEVTKAQTANLDQATTDLTNASPSVIILSDVGRISGNVAERLRGLVEKGGMLIRFAGPRLEQGGDALLPAPLREGGRTLGGAMTWASPQTPAAFEQGSPFEGLAIPKDVTISRQVLADPAAMPRETQVWARLSDGTPLVTATKRGAGTLVFFHITANPDWSNLPISGLFVEMMRKTLEIAPLQVSQSGNAPAASGEVSSVNASQDASLKPWRVLDGFGKLSEPGERTQAIPAAKIRKGAGECGQSGGALRSSKCTEGDQRRFRGRHAQRAQDAGQCSCHGVFGRQDGRARAVAFPCGAGPFPGRRSGLLLSSLARARSNGERRAVAIVAFGAVPRPGF